MIAFLTWLLGLFAKAPAKAPQSPLQAPIEAPATPLAPPPPEPAQTPLEARAAAFAAPFEGFSGKPYRDPVGVWTVGYGSTRDASGNSVCATTPPVTEPEGQALMAHDMAGCLEVIHGAAKVALTDNQTVALADFVYNLGSGNFLKSSLLRLLNTGDYKGAAAEFPKWNLAGGKVLPGLVKRRAAERDLFERA